MISSLVFLLSMAHATEPMPLIQVLKAAEVDSPRIKGARFHEQALTENIRVKKSTSMPDVSFALAASTGHPGSFSLLDVDSDLGTSQRTGEGGAVILKQDIWDFGRTSSSVKAAEAESNLQKQETTLDQIKVDREVMSTYLNCAYLKTQNEAATFMAEQAKVIAQEIQGFVRSGQRSVIERELVDAELKEDQTRIAEFSERVSVVQKRLAIEIGRTDPVSCANLDQTSPEIQKIDGKSDKNPFIAAQTLRVHVAESHLDQARAESRPVFVGMATGGYFDNQTLTNKVNYAAGVGISVPLFSGFRIDANIGRESADLQAEAARMDQARQGVDKANSEYEEQIRALQVRLEFLRKEEILAKDVFSLARKRYFASQGTLIDLREAIKNLNRVVQSTNEATRDLLMARGEQSFFNGARIPE